MNPHARLATTLVALLLQVQVAVAGGRSLGAAVLFADPAIGSVSISPSGEWVVGIARYGERRGILIQRRGQGVSFPIYISKRPILKAVWIGADSLFVRHSYISGERAVVLRFRSEHGSIEHDELGIRREGGLLDPLPDEDDVVLWWQRMGRESVVRRGPITSLAMGTRWKRAGRWAEGSLEVVASLAYPVRYWVSDRHGIVRAALLVEDEETEVASRSLRYRDDNDGSWREIWRQKGLDNDFIPLALAADDHSLLVVAYGEYDTLGIHEFDPDSGELAREVIRRPNVDLIDVIVDYRGDPIAAVYEERGRPEYVYFDSFRAKHLPRMKELGLGPVKVVSASRDYRFLALLVRGPRQPGVFYFYEKTGEKLTRLGEVNPRLDPEDLVSIETLEVIAADGTPLEAFLALPDRADGMAPPLVVYPHGGPIGIRDFGSFHPMTQFLAQAGLAVLRVNYRGSAGYGRTFQSAGEREWGRAIEDDIDAVVAHVIRQGVVDGDRMCIVGGSYGGYSAVMSAIRRPERYRCAATVNGVSDLPLLLAHDSVNPRLRERMVEIVGDPTTEFDSLVKASPVYRVGDLRAPVLIVHGTHDRRVDPEHSHRLSAMMAVHDKPREWFVIKGMRHTPNTKEWRLVAKALRWFVRCHLGEIDAPESQKWRGRTCRPGQSTHSDG